MPMKLVELHFQGDGSYLAVVTAASGTDAAEFRVQVSVNQPREGRGRKPHDPRRKLDQIESAAIDQAMSLCRQLVAPRQKKIDLEAFKAKIAAAKAAKERR